MAGTVLRVRPPWRVDLRRPQLTQLILVFLLGSQCLSGHGANQKESRDFRYDQAREKLDSGDVLNARSDLEQLYSEDPRPAYLLELGVCEFRLGNYEESCLIFARAAQDQPESWEVRLGLARSLVRVDRRRDARKELVWVLERQPQNEQALYSMGLLASAERDYASALAYFKKTLRLYPMNPGALFNAGQMLVRLGDPGQARLYLSRHQEAVAKLNQIYPLKVAARQPGASAAIWVKLGNAYLQAGMQTQALDAFQAARRLGQDPAGAGSLGAMPSGVLPGTLSGGPGQRPPDPWREAFQRGQEHREAGRLEDAIEAFRTAQEKAPRSPESLVAIAEIQMSTGAWKSALETAKSLTRWFPALARGHFLRASCLTRLGRYAGARRWAQRTLGIDPAHKPTLELLDQIDRLETQGENHD